METLSINGTQRADVGKKATKAVRRAGLVPCVIYGKGKQNIHFTVKPHDVRGLVYTGDFKLAEVVIDGTPHRCILKTVDFHHVKDTVYHIDFLELEDNHQVNVEVPLRFEGVSPGVRTGGKFMQSIRKVKIKTIPEFLVDEVIANISELKLGDSIRISDINAIEGIEIMNPANLPIASVVVPRILKDVDDTGEEEGGEEGETEGGEEGGATEEKKD